MVVGWVMTPEDTQPVIPGPVDATFYGKMDFADGIKLRILRWRDYPRLFEWALSAATSVFLRGRQREI